MKGFYYQIIELISINFIRIIMKYIIQLLQNF